VNATVEEAISRLENKFSVQISNSDLMATVEKLLKPIQRQLDYHLPPPLPPQEVFTEANPAKSCKAIYDEYSNAESGYYWIKASTGSAVNVYCKMDANCTGYTGGWMRVAHIDMRNSSHQCPSGFTTLTRSSNPRRVCDTTGYNRFSCPNTSFSVHGLSYRHVYGKISAYQNGYSIAFHYSYNSIDQAYVYGVSLTHGRNPRKHIWTFAGAADETTGRPDLKCPCINRHMSTSGISIPSFIGNDYFYDIDTSLSNSYSSYGRGLYPNDPL
jgi:lipocalin